MKMKSALILVAMAASCVGGYAQNTNTDASTSTNAPAPGAPSAEIMPLIVINEAPLPDAIANLARQAGINIQFDPRALVGPIDPKTQQPGPPPNVTFHWENVTAMQALRALLENYNLQMLDDKNTRIARIAPKEPNALEPLVPRVISLKYSQPTNMVPMVKSILSTRGQVLADNRTGQLVVLATEKEQISVDELVASLDTSPTQILIEARFMETVKNPRTKKGIDWSGTLANHNLTFGNTFTAYQDGLEPRAPTAGTTTVGPGGTLITTPGDPGFAGVPNGIVSRPQAILDTARGFGPIAFLNSDGLNAVVSFLNEDNQTETISTPRTVALEGVPTELSVVQNVPVFEEEQGAQSSGTIQPNTVKPNYNLTVNGKILNEVGTKLIVTPRVFGDTNVFLSLQPEISELGPDATSTLGGRVNTAPTFIRKKVDTQAMVPSGTTLVLGGLQEDRSLRSKTKVPLLGDIPGLGRAFRSEEKEKNKRQLLIFVTPTIMDLDDYVPNAEARDFLKQMPVPKPDVAWGPFDSAEPKDWTQPIE